MLRAAQTWPLAKAQAMEPGPEVEVRVLGTALALLRSTACPVVPSRALSAPSAAFSAGRPS